MKKNTREKIVDTALDLFNNKGLSQITLRTIAKEMGISQGNLNYHYKKRDDIIEALYYRLVADMDESVAKIEQAEIGVQLVYDISAAIMENSYKYRFFLLDFAQIMRNNKKINAHYKKLSKMREEQLLGLMNMMIQAGLIRPEILPNEYSYLYKRNEVFGNFWIGSVEIEKSRIVKKTMLEYLEITIQSIYPYLTDKGVAQYESLKR